MSLFSSDTPNLLEKDFIKSETESITELTPPLKLIPWSN